MGATVPGLAIALALLGTGTAAMADPSEAPPDLRARRSAGAAESVWTCRFPRVEKNSAQAIADSVHRAVTFEKRGPEIMVRHPVIPVLVGRTDGSDLTDVFTVVRDDEHLTVATLVASEPDGAMTKTLFIRKRTGEGRLAAALFVKNAVDTVSVSGPCRGGGESPDRLEFIARSQPPFSAGAPQGRPKRKRLSGWRRGALPARLAGG